jgi:creatinine amidohydrolase
MEECMVRELAKMTTKEVDEYIASGPGIVILPLGSTEQHGPHGAIGTDTFAAIAMAEATAERLDAILAPTLPYGMSEGHVHYRGTLSLKPLLYAQLIRDLCRQFIRDGFRLILLLSSHRTNDAAAECGITEARGEEPVDILYLCYQDVNKGRLDQVLGVDKDSLRPEDVPYGSDGHGGFMETSIAMTQAPDAFRLDRRIEPDRTLVYAKRRLGFKTVNFIEEYAPKGCIFGDPQGSSVELGDKIIAATADEIARRVLEYQNLLSVSGRTEAKNSTEKNS